MEKGKKKGGCERGVKEWKRERVIGYAGKETGRERQVRKGKEATTKDEIRENERRKYEKENCDDLF